MGGTRVLNASIKGVSTAVVAFFAYAQHTYGTLLWVVLALAAIDILLNVQNEGKQFEKLGSAFVAIGAPAILQSHIGSPDMVRVSLAVAAIAYIQILYPQLVSFLKSLHQPSAVVKVELSYLQELEKKYSALAAQTLGTTTPQASQTAPVSVVPASTQNSSTQG